MTRLALALVLVLVACGSPPEPPSSVDPQPSSGLMARVSGALCEVPDVYSWVVDLDSLELTARTEDGATHTVALPDRAFPCALDATHDIELDALIALARPCAEQLGSVGGSPLLEPARVSWSSPRPAHLLVAVPEAEPTTIPRGRDVGIALAAGTCGGVPMD